MRIDVQARGFALTDALRAAVEGEARDFGATFPGVPLSVRVRLFDVNGPRGGRDKGCLIHARIGRASREVVVTDIDGDLYTAIAAAFVKLERSARIALTKARRIDRSVRWPVASNGSGAVATLPER
jgi:ribosome-associated translation inhibitor RaiA